MKKITNLLFSLCLPFSCFISPVSALGEITVEYENGEIEVFSDVEISDTKEVIYFQGGEENKSILMISKKGCSQEGELLVCNDARVGLQSYGVLEEIDVEQIFLFINPSQTKQTINGSDVTMSPNTILLEFITDKGSFVSGFGTVDSNVRPEKALK